MKLSSRNECIAKKVEYVYILQEREFVQSGDPVYKIGRTSQENTKRFAQYPKGSTLILQRTCADSRYAESQIKILFKAKYENAREFGVEYFRGDVATMVKDINRIVSRLLPDSKIPEGIVSLKKPVSTARIAPDIFGETEKEKDERETIPMDIVE